MQFALQGARRQSRNAGPSDRHFQSGAGQHCKEIITNRKRIARFGFLELEELGRQKEAEGPGPGFSCLFEACWILIDLKFS